MEQCKEFMSFDQIVEDMINSMDTIDRSSWQSIDEHEVIKGHFRIGMAIRNYYRLWEEGNPYVIEHPDDMSYNIMVAVWEKLNATA